MPSSYDQIIAAYDGAAGELAERYDALPVGAVFGDVRHLFPDGGMALDVGAGSGRDARWLSSLGFEVVAVEPARGFRVFGECSRSTGVRWLDDRLPALNQVHRLALSFDLITDETALGDGGDSYSFVVGPARYRVGYRCQRSVSPSSVPESCQCAPGQSPS